MRKLLGATLMSVVLLMCAEVSAQVYVGGMYGVSDASYQGDDDSSVPDLEGDAGFRLYLGNEISRSFAVEFSYLTLGDYEVGTLDGEDDPTEVSDTISIIAFDASFVGKLPIRRRLSLFGRIGVIYWEGERVIVENALGTGETTLLEFDDADVSLGLGVEYQFRERFGVTLEVDQYKTGDYYNLLYGISLYATM